MLKRSWLFLFLFLSMSLMYCGTPTPTGEGAGSESAKESSGQTEKATEVASVEKSNEPSGEELVSKESTPDAAPDVIAPEPEPTQPDETRPEPQPEPSKPDVPLDPKLGTYKCGMTPPSGATLAAAPPAYSGGTRPTFKVGSNKIKSGGAEREFILVLPKTFDPSKTYPVIFLWHWLKGSASKFLTRGEIQSAVDQQDFIAVLPEKKGDIKFKIPIANTEVDFPWPFMTSPVVSDARMQEEFKFFDDMLACVSAQYKVDKECVSSAGVSAGALFTVQLAQARSQYLSSFISLSGGIGSQAGGFSSNGLIRGWKSPTRKLPGLVLWGGAEDSCVLLNFETASKELEKKLTSDGHFFVECIHDCKHGEPPVTPPAGQSRYAPIWDFAFSHPYWMKEGASPYQVKGWPSSVISWCGIGAGSATQRSGKCGDPSCPI